MPLRVIVLISFVLASLTGCESKIRSRFFGSTDDSFASLSGKFLAARDTALQLDDACQPGKAQVEVNELTVALNDLVMASPLATAPLGADGSYHFGAIEGLKSGLAAGKNYTVSVKICGAYYSRLVTRDHDQDISSGSTLLEYALAQGMTGRAETDRDQIDRLVTRLEAEPSFTAAYGTLTGSADETGLFVEIFNKDPSLLETAPPRIMSWTMPANANEHEPVTFAATAAHWNPGYRIAYLWKIGDALHDGGNYTYQALANDQGQHAVSLFIGQADDKGALVQDRRYLFHSSVLTVADTVPATPPDFAVQDSRTVGGQTFVTSRDLEVVLATGAGRHSCESFSALALTENADDAPPPSAFTVTCTDDGQQLVPYRLTTPGDGLKHLQLWAADATGRTGAAKSVDVILDSSVPSFNAAPLANEAADGYLNLGEHALTHAVIAAASGNGFDAAAYKLVTASVACDDSLAYEAALPSNNSPAISADGAYKVCVKLSDQAGNPPAFGASPSFQYIGTQPVFTSIDLINDAVGGYLNAAEQTHTNALVGNLTASGYQTVKYAIKLAIEVCSGALGGYSNTVPTANAAVATGQGLHKICLELADAAGNKTYAESPAFTVDTTTPVFSSLSLAGSVADGYLNTAEKALTTDLASGLTGSGYDQVLYALAPTATSCASVATYGVAVPKNNDSGFGADGSYKVCAKLTDAAGNPPAYGASADFVLDTVAPVFTSVPFANDALGGFLNSSERASTAAVLGTLSASGYTDVQYQVASSTATCSLLTSYATAAPKSNDGGFATDGSYKICLKLADAAGNVTYGDSAALTVDTAPPATFNITGPTAYTASSTPTTAWEAATGAVTFDLVVSASSTCAAALQTYTSLSGTSQALTSLSDGLYYACLTAHDTAGNSRVATNSGYAFTVDTASPTLSALSLNGGATTATQNTLQVALTAADSTKITDFCLKYNDTVKPTATASCWVAVNAPGVGLTPGATLTLSAYFYQIGFVAGTYSVYAWTKDAAGNISNLSNAGNGTAGQDTASIDYAPGTPPVVSGILATKTDAPSAPAGVSDLTITAGQDVYIKWRAEDVEGLAANPISLFYTTDDVNYTQVAANLPNSANGACQVDDAATTADDQETGCYLWAGGAPTSGYFKVRVSAKDTSSMITFGASPPVNAPHVKIIAGNIEPGLGASATSALFFSQEWNDSYSLAVKNDGTIFFRDAVKGLVVISPTDGVLRTLVPTTGTSTGDGGPVTAASFKAIYRIALDYNNGLLIQDYDRIRRIDLAASPMTITTIVGGGTSTADLANPLDVQMNGSFGAYPSLLSLVPLPNGQIYFFSEYPGTVNSPQNGGRIRIYDPALNKVKTLRPSGTATVGGSSFDVTTCDLRSFALDFDPVTSVVNHLFVRCLYFNPLNLDPTTGQGLAPEAHIPGDWTTAWIQGHNGQVYVAAKNATGYLYHYDAATDTSSIVAGIGTNGVCSDGTPALSCPMRPHDMFASDVGTIFFVDHGMIRTIDAEGKVRTIAGQSFSYGDGKKATEARFSTIRDLGLTDSGSVILMDNDENRIREFPIDGNINTIAGNSLLQIPDTTTLAVNQGFAPSTMAIDPTTGDVFHLRGARLAKLDRSTGKWVDIAGGGSTNHATTLSGDLAAADLTVPFAFYIHGFHDGKLLVAAENYAGGVIDAMLMVLDTATNMFTHTLGVTGPFSTSICADGTSELSCGIPASYWYPTLYASYDTSNNRWLNDYAYNGATTIHSFAPGSTVSTLVAPTRRFVSFAYVKKTTPTPLEIVYFCGTDGLIYSHDMINSVEAALPWPIPSMTCQGRTLEYSSTRNSLIFPFKSNGLFGVAEYSLDP